MPPQVSVVVPTHNRSRLLGLTLRSILWQQDVDFEVIVVDDGSTDDTAAVVDAFHDPRVRLVRHEISQGVSSARNRGITEAEGGWIAFCDDDDLWAPDKLAQQLQAAREAGAGWVYGGAVHIDPHGRICGGTPPLPPEELVSALRRWNPMPGGCSNVAVSADVFSAVGHFDPKLQIVADWDLWLRIMRRGPPAWVPSPLVAYRLHSANMSLDVNTMVAELRMLDRGTEPHVDWPGFYRHAGTLALRGGRRGTAIRCFWRAARGGTQDDVRKHPSADLALIRGLVLSSVERRLRWLTRSSGVTARPPEVDQNVAWKDEARVWLEQLSAST